MAKEKEDLVDVVVLKGHTIHHDGVIYGPTKKVSVTKNDADRLVALGRVTRLSVLMESINAAQSPVAGNNAVTIEDGTSVIQG